MVLSYFNDYLFYIPQFFLSVSILVGIVVFVAYADFFRSNGWSLTYQASAYFSLMVFLSILLLLPLFFYNSSSLSGLLFSPLLNTYAIVAFSITFVILVLYGVYSYYLNFNSYEISVFIMLVLLSTLLLIFGNNILILYLAIELQALALYVLAAAKLNSTYSTEAGLKYFVLGSFASCLLVFGISLIYGTTGLLNLNELSLFLNSDLSIGVSNSVLLALLMISIGLLFKVGVVPFHFWVPDVYTGSATPVTAFFASVPKIGVWVVILKISIYCLFNCSSFFSFLFLFLGVITLIVGFFGAIYQISLKRLLAFSAIGQTGYLLIGVAANHSNLFVANLVYLFVYLISLLSVFILLILCLPRNNATLLDTMYSLKVLHKHSSIASTIFVFSIFSLAGLPPFSGFFSKLYLLYTLADSKFLFAVLAVLLCSAASVVYYLKLIRYSFFFKFDKIWIALEDFNRVACYFLVILFVLNIYFFIWGFDFLKIMLYLSFNFL